jgi:type IV pilus assembly protein PilE
MVMLFFFMDKKNTDKGFSLFELLVSISIIGILMAVAMVSYSSAQKKARDNRRMQDMNNIQKAAEQYYATNNYVYPPSGDIGVVWRTGSNEDILTKWPTDPKNVTPYTYYYTVSNNFDIYCVCAQLEETGKGNSSAACTNFGTGTTHYCVKNQQ